MDEVKIDYDKVTEAERLAGMTNFSHEQVALPEEPKEDDEPCSTVEGVPFSIKIHDRKTERVYRLTLTPGEFTEAYATVGLLAEEGKKDLGTVFVSMVEKAY